MSIEENVKKETDDSDGESVTDNSPQLSIEQMIENVNKTKQEIRKKLYPKSRLMVKSSDPGNKFTIDLNLNMKLDK